MDIGFLWSSWDHWWIECGCITAIFSLELEKEFVFTQWILVCNTFWHNICSTFFSSYKRVLVFRISKAYKNWMTILANNDITKSFKFTVDFVRFVKTVATIDENHFLIYSSILEVGNCFGCLTIWCKMYNFSWIYFLRHLVKMGKLASFYTRSAEVAWSSEVA